MSSPSATENGIRSTTGDGYSRAKSVLLTVPVVLWGLFVFTPALRSQPQLQDALAILLVVGFMTYLFFKMVRTGKTHQWRRIFFVALGFLFPVGFIWELVTLRSSMSITLDQMVTGNTPFCFLVIPMTLVPAAVTKTIIFPGSILPTEGNPHAVASMFALWIMATLALGRGWCAYACFFGGIEEGFASLLKNTRVKRIDRKWTLMPWAVLVAMVVLSTATLTPIYCEWLCPFKAVTEFEELNSFRSIVQAGIFVSLFFGLVVVLPLLTKRRTQCAMFCPFGPFQSLFNKISPFEILIDRQKCTDCQACEKICPTLSLSEEAVKQGKTPMSCTRCGACVDVCSKDAALWHIRGTSIKAPTHVARTMFLLAAWFFAVLFGGGILVQSLGKILGLLVRGI